MSPAKKNLKDWELLYQSRDLASIWVMAEHLDEPFVGLKTIRYIAEELRKGAPTKEKIA